MKEFWIDHKGRQWSVSKSARALKFNIPSHAALRAFIFHRDGYRCRRCPAEAAVVPTDYSGRFGLSTNTFNSLGGQDQLIVDHVLTRRAGGRNLPINLQTLCETCNRKKITEDKRAFGAHMAGELRGQI